MQQHATITEMPFKGDVEFRSATKPRGRPLHKLLVSFSAAYFTGALITDLVYWHMPDVLWERFSIWLIVAGLVMAGLGIVAYIVDLAVGLSGIKKVGEKVEAHEPMLFVHARTDQALASVLPLLESAVRIG